MDHGGFGVLDLSAVGYRYEIGKTVLGYFANAPLQAKGARAVARRQTQDVSRGHARIKRRKSLHFRE
jgi:hypothetical protein